VPPNYTEEMQDFFAKTTDDFDEDRKNSMVLGQGKEK